MRRHAHSPGSLAVPEKSLKLLVGDSLSVVEAWAGLLDQPSEEQKVF
jgi:hypothetical protein